MASGGMIPRITEPGFYAPQAQKCTAGFPSPKTRADSIERRLTLGLGIVHAGLASAELFTLTSRAERARMVVLGRAGEFPLPTQSGN